MKVIDIISRLFGSEKGPEITGFHEKTDNLDVRLPLAGGEISLRLTLEKYDIVILITRKGFPAPDFGKWVSRFEYELEQTFFSNIRVEVHTEGENYRIRISP